jgi:hypothetical protein
MNAYKIETVLSEDGALVLKDLPFHTGDAVEVIILERSRCVSESESRNVPESAYPSPAPETLDQLEQNLYPLRGKVLYYEDPFEPAVPTEDWEVLK